MTLYRIYCKRTPVLQQGMHKNQLCHITLYSRIDTPAQSMPQSK